MPSDKISCFLAEARPPTPCLVVDLGMVAENYRRLIPNLDDNGP